MAEPAREVKTVAVTFGGELYSADDLTIGDVAEIEEEFGEVIEDIDWRRKKAVIWLVWLVRRQKSPDLPIEAVSGTSILDLLGAEARPTEDGEGASPSEPSGDPGSSASTESDPGSTSA